MEERPWERGWKDSYQLYRGDIHSRWQQCRKYLCFFVLSSNFCHSSPSISHQTNHDNILCIFSCFVFDRRPKTQRGSRAVEHREPKNVENTKTALFLRGGKTSEVVTNALKDLVSTRAKKTLWFKREVTGLRPGFNSKLDGKLSTRFCNTWMYPRYQGFMSFTFCMNWMQLQTSKRDL